MGVQVMMDEADKARIDPQRQFDPLGLRNKDPNKHYRWAKKSESRVGYHKFRGYSVTEKVAGGVEAMASDNTIMKKGVDADTSIQIGDLVLMETSKENHDRLNAQVADKTQRQTRSIGSDFRRRVRKDTGEDLGYEDHKETKRR